MKKKLALMMVVGLVAALAPISGAQAAPAIQLLNPSAYNAAPELSTKADVDGAYHFVAWVPQLPPQAFVEFEVVSGASNPVTIEANPVGSDTFEAFHPLTGIADGPATVRAILFSGGTQFGEGDSQTVTINNSDVPPPTQSETAEILHPTNGGTLGFFTPKDGLPRTIIDVRTSAGARQVRALFTISRPGTEPEWTMCGTGSVRDALATVRCTLPDKISPAQVTAVAALANQTPPPTPAQPAADDSGDVHRVTTYASVPTRVTITPEAIKAEVSTCQELTARVLDQQSRPLQNVNVDVHAVGPTDQLQFAATGDEDDFQAPNTGPHSMENTRQCNDLAAEGKQGETNRVQNPDEKHIESVTTGSNAGTDNAGSFTFFLYSDVIGGTNVTAFADVNDDDLQASTEASGGARIGWGQDPPPPTRQVFIEPSSPSTSVGSCQTLTVTVKESGNSVSSGNLDIHLSGGSPSFCATGGGTTPRDPDSGEHVAGTHSDGTRHGEAELNSVGQLTFGVTSSSEGEVTVLAWLDETDDDTLVSPEPSTSTKVGFGVNGDRNISLQASRRRVPKGRSVRLFGEISGGPSCSEGQVVKLKARRPSGGRFRTIKSGSTTSSGEYAFRVRVRATKDYRTVAPRDGVCNAAKSNIVRVRARG